MGGADWRDRLSLGFPMLRDLAEPGVYPPGYNVAKLISRVDLFQPANSRVKLSKKGGGLGHLEAAERSLGSSSWGMAEGPSKLRRQRRAHD